MDMTDRSYGRSKTWMQERTAAIQRGRAVLQGPATSTDSNRQHSIYIPLKINLKNLSLAWKTVDWRKRTIRSPPLVYLKSRLFVAFSPLSFCSWAAPGSVFRVLITRGIFSVPRWSTSVGFLLCVAFLRGGWLGFDLLEVGGSDCALTVLLSRDIQRKVSPNKWYLFGIPLI